VGRYPVQRSGTGHDVDLVGMDVLTDESGVGSKLVTASSDGKIHYWSVSNMREPLETFTVNANLSCLDVKGDFLVVSQFTLHASTKKGNRPSYIKAAHPNQAQPMYEQFVNQLQQELSKPIQTGVFGAYMKVSLLNDGPVTIIIDSKNRVL
jgi:WD40 repeat protein